MATKKNKGGRPKGSGDPSKAVYRKDGSLYERKRCKICKKNRSTRIYYNEEDEVCKHCLGNEEDTWAVPFHEEVEVDVVEVLIEEGVLEAETAQELPPHGDSSPPSGGEDLSLQLGGLYFYLSKQDYIYSLQNNKQLIDEWNLLKQETPPILPLPESTSNHYNPKTHFLCKRCLSIFPRTERFRQKRLLCTPCGYHLHKEEIIARYHRRKENPGPGRPKTKRKAMPKKRGRPTKQLAKNRRYKEKKRKEKQLLEKQRREEEKRLREAEKANKKQ